MKQLLFSLLMFCSISLFSQNQVDSIIFLPRKVNYKFDIGLSISNQSFTRNALSAYFPFATFAGFRAYIPKWKAGIRYRNEIYFITRDRIAQIAAHYKKLRVSHYYIQGLDIYKDIPLHGKTPFDLRVGGGVEFITPYWVEEYSKEKGRLYFPLSLANVYTSVPFGGSTLELRAKYALNDNKPAMFRYSYLNLSYYYSFPRKCALKEKWIKKTVK